MKSQKVPDIKQNEFTVMDGFIYRTINDVSNKYACFTTEGQDKKFPILPVGMRELWASEGENDVFNGMF